MAKTQTILQIFVASPGDIIEERKILHEVINEINITWSDSQKIRLELLLWETHTFPSFGDDAQDVINKQIGDDYDIFLGIMWGRFGSKTKQYESGTEEEFERAYRRLTESSEHVHIMFYFKDTAIPPSKLNPIQLGKVQSFKKRISSEYGGLCHNFETLEQFQTKVRIHLSKIVQDWIKTPMTHANAKSISFLSPKKDTIDPLANLTALTDDKEDGLIELIENAEDAMMLLVSVLNKMTEAMNVITQNIRQRTKDLKALSVNGIKPDIKAIKRISNNAANDFEVYVQRMSIEIPEFQKQHSTTMDAFGKIAIISSTDFDKEMNDINETLKQIEGYHSVVTTTFIGITKFRESVDSLPRMTTTFNRARKRAVAITDDLLVQIRNAVDQVKDVEELLKRMLEEENKKNKSN